MPIDELAILIGRNSSGKSNALDALDVLSRLATGEELADALDGRRREAGPVRGGSLGCAPHGTKSFTLGCTVKFEGEAFTLDVEVQVEPELQIIREELWGPAPAVKSRRVAQRQLFATRTPDENSAGLVAEVFNGRRGNNPPVTFRDSRLLTSQLPLRVNPTNIANRAVIRGAETILSALRGVFHLDPVPHLMRDYTPENDSELRRTGANLSAAVGRLRNESPESFSRLCELVSEVADHRVEDIDVTRSPLNDVMLVIKERSADDGELTSAKEMSDGLLRFIAIATSLLTSTGSLDIDPGLSPEPQANGVVLVIEELENGLHPSQAGKVLAPVIHDER